MAVGRPGAELFGVLPDLPTIFSVFLPYYFDRFFAMVFDQFVTRFGLYFGPTGEVKTLIFAATVVKIQGFRVFLKDFIKRLSKEQILNQLRC